MNYKTIHSSLIEYARKTRPRQRLSKRNPFDPRLKIEALYIEIHHIIPRSLGGTDEDSNLIELLPEEHLFIHMLRYKIFQKREDALAVRCMLNGFSFNPNRKHHGFLINKKIRMGYAWLRTHAQNVRKNEGWHTPDGEKRISEARKGTMPARDVATGKIIGSVSTQHSNVLSGKWVHHSKGRIQTEKELEFKRKKYKGQDNPNASGLSEEYFIQKSVEFFKEFGRILSHGQIFKLSQERDFKWIKSWKSRFEKRGVDGLYEEVEKITGAKYDPYFHQRNRKL